MTANEMVIHAPGSKSQTQRALLLAAMARGESVLRRPLTCDDSEHLAGALGRLGVGVDRRDDDVWRITGVGGAPRDPDGPLQCGEGGTTLRFLAPMCLLLEGPLELHGQGRLGRRPQRGLIRALAGLGVEAEQPDGASALPLILRSREPVGRRAAVEVHESSQFASALLMAGPCLPRGLELELRGPLVSRPYLEMTFANMARFGVTVREQESRLLVEPGVYEACELEVEGDWSGGAFLLAAGWITRLPLEVPNLNPASVQGDRAFAGFLERLDEPAPRTFSLDTCPDLVAPLAAVCALAHGASHITDVAHARHKESDRLAVLARGLAAAGVAVQELPGGLTIQGAADLRPARLDPAGDHRMAMAFGLLSLRQPGIEILDPACVAKSYPRFWQDLEALRP